MRGPGVILIDSLATGTGAALLGAAALWLLV